MNTFASRIVNNQLNVLLVFAALLFHSRRVGYMAVLIGIFLLQPTRAQTVAQREIKPNTIAVLPVPFLNSLNNESSEEMSKFAQNDIYNALLEKLSNIMPLTVQDLRTTNSLLRKAGISYKSIDETSIEDLQQILGVDHIIAAKVLYVPASSQITTNTGSVQANDKSISNNSIATSSTDLKFKYSVYFDLYKVDSKIYSKTRQPFLETKDAWKDSMNYLLKRSPIYVK